MRPFTPSKLGEGLHAFTGDSAVSPARPAGDALAVVAGAVLGTKPVRLEGATLTSKQVHAFCDHIDQLVRARVFDSQTFTLLTTPQSIMAMGLRFMTSKVMARTPVADWKTEWSVATILEALKECYPIEASDSFVSTYDKWLLLSKSMRKTIKVNRTTTRCFVSSSPRFSS